MQLFEATFSCLRPPAAVWGNLQLFEAAFSCLRPPCPLRAERQMREARREIFTTPGLVTTRRSTLGPPAEGWPGSSTIKNPNYKYDSLPIAPIYHTFHTVNTISILLLMNQTSEVLLEGKFLSRPIRKYRTVMRISANLRFAPRGRKSQRVFWPKAPHLMRTYLM